MRQPASPCASPHPPPTDLSDRSSGGPAAQQAQGGGVLEHQPRQRCGQGAHAREAHQQAGERRHGLRRRRRGRRRRGLRRARPLSARPRPAAGPARPPAAQRRPTADRAARAQGSESDDGVTSKKRKTKRRSTRTQGGKRQAVNLSKNFTEVRPSPPAPAPRPAKPGPRARGRRAPARSPPRLPVDVRSCSRSWSTTSTPSTCRTTCPPRRGHPAARPATFAWCVARLAPTPTRWTAPGATAGLAAAGPPVPGASGRCLPAQALLQVLGGPQVLRDLHGNQRCALAHRLGAAFLLDRASRLWGSAVRLRAMMRRYATAARVTLYTAESSESSHPLAQNVLVTTSSPGARWWR